MIFNNRGDKNTESFDGASTKYKGNEWCLRALLLDLKIFKWGKRGCYLLVLIKSYVRFRGLRLYYKGVLRSCLKDISKL